MASILIPDLLEFIDRDFYSNFLRVAIRGGLSLPLHLPFLASGHLKGLVLVAIWRLPSNFCDAHCEFPKETFS